METNTPSHYGGKDNPYEPLKIIQHYGLGFEIGNVIKYCLRAGKKDGESEVKDLRKAIDYLTRRVEWLESHGVNAEPTGIPISPEDLEEMKKIYTHFVTEVYPTLSDLKPSIVSSDILTPAANLTEVQPRSRDWESDLKNDHWIDTLP